MAFDVSSIFAQQVQAVSKSDTGRELMQVDIDDLVGNDANFYAVDEDKLEDLKNSIALSGIMDPPTVTPAEDGKYRLISGHRRTAAVRRWLRKDARIFAKCRFSSGAQRAQPWRSWNSSWQTPPHAC